MISTLDHEQTETLLRSEVVGRIGCTLSGKIYVVPISYAYDGIAVYAHTYEGLKMTAMRQHPQICFEVDNWRQMGAWKSVIAWGRFEELTEEKDRYYALNTLLQRKLPALTSVTMQLGSTWPFTPDSAEKLEGIFFKIVLENKTGRCEQAHSSAMPHS